MAQLHFPAYVEVAPNRYRERFGLDFEDFQVGQIFRHRPGYTLTQQDNIADCMDTLNQAMLHYDSHYAAQTEFGKPLMVTTAIVQRLIGMTWKTFNRRKRIVRFAHINMLSPVYAGDTLYAESEVTAVADAPADPDCGLITTCCTGRKQDGTAVCEMVSASLIYRKDALPYSAHGY